MTLTPEQYERLINAADCHFDEHNGDPWDYGPFIAAARADLAAMRAPITAEALVAAGWKQASGDDMVYFTMKAGPCLEIEFNLADEWSVTIDMPEAMSSILFRGVRTMYDLRELVRLLGGAK